MIDPKETIEFIKSKVPNSTPLFIVVRGSQAYGTNTPESDIDLGGVYCQPLESILGEGYVAQINDDKNDAVFYELKRFLELLRSANPTMLELLSTPEDCILYKDKSFDLIVENRDKFLTKKCRNSFGGYAVEQIVKAKGQNKKQNMEKEKMVRKTPLDFCYILDKEHSIPFMDFIEEYGYKHEFCGISKMPHSKDVYSLFYDKNADFGGIAFEKSNSLRLSSIPKGSDDKFIGHLFYNKDAYSIHCGEWNSYQTWLKNRNEQRWVDVQSHNQKIDGKNMLHCRRLIDMAIEIGSGQGVNVRRKNAEYLISIRKGKVSLEDIIQQSELDIKKLDTIFKSSNLPEDVDRELINNLLIDIRKNIYNL